MVDSNQPGPVLRVKYRGDGKQTEFYIPFRIFSPNDVEVYVDSNLETDSYYIRWPQNDDQQFSVVFLAPPPDNLTITIRRLMTKAYAFASGAISML